MPLEIKYHEVTIESIFKYFVDGYTPSPGTKIINYEANYDPRTGKVIFKLIVEKVDKENTKSV